MGRLTALLLATSAGLLLWPGRSVCCPSCRGRAPRSAPAGGTAKPFGARSPRVVDHGRHGEPAAGAPAADDPRPTPSWPASTCRRRGRPATRPTTARPRGAIQEVARRADDPLALVLGHPAAGPARLRRGLEQRGAGGRRGPAGAARTGCWATRAGAGAVRAGRGGLPGHDRPPPGPRFLLPRGLRPGAARRPPGGHGGHAAGGQRRGPAHRGGQLGRVQLGHLHFLSGDLEGAERQYEQALQLLPDYVHAAGQGRVAAPPGATSRGPSSATRGPGADALPEFAIALGDLYRATGDLQPARSARTTWCG